MKTKAFYKFGRYAVDPEAKIVLEEGQPLRLTRKVVETLLVLAENSGRVVPKEELMSSIWPDRMVDEANLKQNIAVIRRALPIAPGCPGHIETYPGRGYRMVGPVAMEDNEPQAAAARPRGQRARPLLVAWTAVASLALGVLGWSLLNKDAPEANFRVAPVTRLPGKEFQPAVTGDGRKVAFVWVEERSGKSGIWIQNAGSANPLAATRQDGRYTSPAWDPAGERLAYLRMGATSTDVLIAEPGGSERLLASLPSPDFGYDYRQLDWSPDGRWIAVSHADSLELPLGLSLIDTATGERRRLTQPEDTVGGDLDPRFSPDGRYISFVRLIHRSNQELFLQRLDGSPPRQLTHDGRQISGHDWSAGGKRIVLASDRGGEFRLWRMDPLAVSPQKSLRALGIFAGFPMQLSLARSDATLVYSVSHQDRNIWRLDLKKRTWTPVVASTGQDASPQYSPSGDRICFRSDRSGEEQLWVSRADGSDPTPVTRGPYFPSVGRWAPDGRAIVFNNARTREIFIASPDPSGAWTVRSLGARGVHPVYSPDGEWIYAGADESILRIPAAGGRPEEVVKARGLSLAASPGGRFLYFMREPYGTSIWRVALEDGTVTKVMDGVVAGCTSCWDVGESGIYYLGSQSRALESQTINYHDFATGRSRQVARYPEPLSPLGSGPFSLSPDRRYLLCVRLEPSPSDLMQVQPFE